MTKEVEYEFTTLEAIEHIHKPDLPIMFDSETIGFFGRIRLAQFYQEGWDCVKFVEYPDPMMLVAFLSKKHFVAYNAHYDITCIQDNLGGLPWVPEHFDCGLLAARLFYFKGEKFSFDQAIYYATGENPYSNKKEMQAEDWSGTLSEDQLEYAAKDVMWLVDVWNDCCEIVEDINYKLDILATRYCLDFQCNGLPIDVKRIEERIADNNEKIAQIALPINCNSYQQVRRYIESDMSDDHGLATLIAEGNEKAAAVRETRKITKENSFLKKFLATQREEKIFGKFMINTRSGRSASKEQNLQQLPRSLKSMFGVPKDSGQVLIYTDFAQIQLRGVCVVTGDKTMEALFRNGADMHNYVAEMIFGKNFTKQHRQISKTANFGLLFGAGITVFLKILLDSVGLVLSEKEGSEIKKKWLSLWVQIAAWQQAGAKAWRNGLAWETPLGRRYTAKRMTDQLANQIQGFEAEVAKLALHYMLPRLKELDERIKLCNWVHDSYIFTGPNEPEIYKAASKIIGDAMVEAWFEMCQSVRIKDLPMPTEVSVGFNWGDIDCDNPDVVYVYNNSGDKV